MLLIYVEQLCELCIGYTVSQKSMCVSESYCSCVSHRNICFILSYEEKLIYITHARTVL